MPDNMAMVRRYFEEVLGAGRVDPLNVLVAPDYIDHTARSGRASGSAGIREMVSLFHTAFPDLVITVEDTITQHDRVATRFTIGGTQAGPFAGVAPKGRRVLITGIAISRVANGWITEHWDQADMLGLLQQLDALPDPGQSGQ
jgi:steroid delta-isomerase-like uncharacterized protein